MVRIGIQVGMSSAGHRLEYNGFVGRCLERAEYMRIPLVMEDMVANEGVKAEKKAELRLYTFTHARVNKSP